jgi:hypothetical protein
MSSFHDPVVRRELPIIAQIIRDETWLEAERRGRPVPPDDPVVRDKVSEIILRIGGELRLRLTRECQTAEDAQNAA